ncbi:LLM class flavin-dependent oxidoreductase [Desertibaculum subflavum]|uniref:LLM class flavin-dependent oxidoreductase n=1 Tax=Desertibaculum subflavum TaxID=2268458 RepID=UPI000E66E9D6
MRISIFTVLDHHPGRARSMAELYAQVTAQARLAEALGYHAFYVAEHHFHEYGACPNPAVLLASLAPQTTRIRLGTAIAALAFRNPVEVAESYALVDVLSGGRLELGLGSGYLAHEFAGFNIDPAEKRERFDENLYVLTRLLAGEKVSFQGRWNRLSNVQINVAPVQHPVPIAVATLRPEGAYDIGAKGHNMLCVPYASVGRFEEIQGLIAQHHKGLRKKERKDFVGATGVTLHTYVAATDAEARAEAAEAFDLYVATRLYARRQTYDDVIASGLALFGSVETVAEKMLQLADWGVDHVIALADFGLLPFDRVERSMRLFAEEVLPRVQQRLTA